jgi:pimeloyl-ACP methyl ester carboxylesterase
MSAQKNKSPSWLDKFNAGMVLLITPEYAVVKRSRSAGYGTKPTFPKPGYPQSLATIDPKLANINKPVLIFWGEQDQLLLVDNAHRLSQGLKRSRLHVLRNCGHFSYQDQHEEFGRMMIDWISAGYKTL